MDGPLWTVTIHSGRSIVDHMTGCGWEAIMRMFLLTTHIAAGSLGLLAGPMAMLMPKRPGWHPLLGLASQLLVALLCLSAGGFVTLKPSVWWLGVIAELTWAAVH